RDQQEKSGGHDVVADGLLEPALRQCAVRRTLVCVSLMAIGSAVLVVAAAVAAAGLLGAVLGSAATGVETIGQGQQAVVADIARDGRRQAAGSHGALAQTPCMSEEQFDPSLHGPL